MKWTRNAIILVVTAALITLAAMGTAAAYAVTGFHARAVATAPPAQAPSTQEPATQPPAQDPATQPPAQAPARPSTQAPAPVQPQLTNPAAVVLQYYQDVTDHNWQAAWALGGRDIAAQDGQTYDSWVTGYTTTTASIDVTDHGTWSNGTVWTDLSAVQLDGSVRIYSGTYTVQDGVIVSAHITQTGGPSS